MSFLAEFEEPLTS